MERWGERRSRARCSAYASTRLACDASPAIALARRGRGVGVRSACVPRSRGAASPNHFSSWQRTRRVRSRGTGNAAPRCCVGGQRPDARVQLAVVRTKKGAEALLGDDIEQEEVVDGVPRSRTIVALRRASAPSCFASTYAARCATDGRGPGAACRRSLTTEHGLSLTWS